MLSLHDALPILPDHVPLERVAPQEVLRRAGVAAPGHLALHAGAGLDGEDAARLAHGRARAVDQIETQALRSEEHTSELQSQSNLVCRLLHEKNKRTLMQLVPSFSPGLAAVLFVGLFIGLAIKVPVFPFHTWLPDAHVEAPTAVSVILAGILLKMGTYGLFRISFPLLPDMAKEFALFMAILGLINIVYGALCAMAQDDLKKLVAYSSISH